MNKSFLTKTITNKDINKVVVYGLNKVYCNGCTTQLQHLQMIFACQDPVVFTDKPEREYRDIHCFKCMHQRNFYCDKLSVSNVGGQHVDMKARLYICPVKTDIDDYMHEVLSA